MELTARQVADFHEKGYIYVGEVLNGADLERARLAYEALMAAEESDGGPRDLGLQEEDAAEKRQILQVMNAWSKSDLFWKLAARPDIVAAAQALIGTGALRLYSDQCLYKPPKHCSRVLWHQDNGYWKLEPPTAVSMWLAFDDADETNGCMRVIPGLHKGGLLEHKPNPDRGNLRGLDIDTSGALPMCFPAGHAMMHHCLTPHGTDANESDQPRRAIAITYMDAASTQDGKPLEKQPLLTGGGP